MKNVMCACGCGQALLVKPHHRYQAARYLPQHFQNSAEFRRAKKARSIKPPPDWVPPSGLCECGCGEKTLIATITARSRGQYAGHPMRFVHGHNGRGQRCTTWKGGRKQNSEGYWLRWAPDHPNAMKSGYVFEHRLVWEEANGRLLERDEHVHHLDGDRSNNDPANLVALKRRQHFAFHATDAETRKRKSDSQRKRFASSDERDKMSKATAAAWARRKTAT